jgi:hypothetical protein
MTLKQVTSNKPTIQYQDSLYSGADSDDMETLKQELFQIVKRKSKNNKNKNKSDGEDSTKNNNDTADASPIQGLVKKGSENNLMKRRDFCSILDLNSRIQSLNQYDKSLNIINDVTSK